MDEPREHTVTYDDLTRLVRRVVDRVGTQRGIRGLSLGATAEREIIHSFVLELHRQPESVRVEH